MEKVSRGTNNFAIRLHRLLCQDVSDHNICLSPYSVFSSLVVIYLGARGDTAKQMAEVLGLRGKSTSKLHEICAWVMFFLKESGGRREEFLTANQLFIRADIDIRMDYDQWAEAYYNTTPVSMDFSNASGCQRRINQWIHKQTNGSMQDLIPDGGIGSRLVMLAVNVAYFKGLWRGTFPPEATYKCGFHCSSNSLMEADMMYKEESLYYGDFPDLRCQVVFLPLSRTQGWMTILLPYKGNSIAEVEYLLNYDRFNGLRKHVKKHLVNIHLPKFHIECSLQLSKALPILGIEDLFETGHADLSAMLECPPEELCVTDFVHKAALTVEEAGRPTAKRKPSLSCMSSSHPLQTVDMVVDRPFVFYVQDGISRIIVFSGHVVKPVALEEADDRLRDLAL